MMRTTVDLPDDLHGLARQLAHDSKRSMSDVLVELIRSGLRVGRPASIAVATRRGLPQISLGHPVTVDDVRSLDDDE